MVCEHLEKVINQFWIGSATFSDVRRTEMSQIGHGFHGATVTNTHRTA
jgi:hypothetical protein